MQLPQRLTNLPQVGQQRTTARYRITIRIAIAALAIMVVGAGCAKARLPSSDSTPPILYWVVVDGETGERTETPTDQSFSQVTVKGHAVVTLVAKDGQGVHRIRLYDPSVSWVCTDGSVNSGSGPGLGTGSYDEQKLKPDSNGIVLTEIILLDTAYFTAGCDPGWWLLNETYFYGGEAENYYGGVTESKLQVIYKP
jgi:hypothetical protein